MKRPIQFISVNVICVLISAFAHGQVSISTTGSAPDSSAMLDIQSTSKGLLIPRMSTTLRDSISNPATGLLVFDMDSTQFYFYTGATWEKVNTQEISSLIADIDNDTKIEVEKTADDDLIRFHMAGTEFMRMDGGRLEVLNTGNSIFLGEEAGQQDDFSNNNNIGIGYRALKDNTTGNENIGIGSGVLMKSTGSQNNGFGAYTLTNNTTGNDNTAYGDGALYSNSTGSSNTAIGAEALKGNTTSSYNTALGYRAGDLASGSGNLFLGPSAGSNASGNNKLYIENSGSSSPLIYGEFDNDLVAINGTLRLNDGTQADGYVLTTDATGNAGWTSASSLAITTAFDTLSGVVLPGNAVDITSDNFVFGSTQLNADGNPDHDARFFFNKGKGAFRAGKVTGDKWDDANVGSYSFASGGGTRASGAFSTAMGAITTAPSAYETSIGSYNTDYIPNSTTAWTASDRLFTIGNGTSLADKSDALVMLKSGNIGVGTSSPDTTLHVVGQIRYEDGNQTNGYVLTSDYNGNARWTAVTMVFDTVSGVVIPGSAVDNANDDFVFGSTQLDSDGDSDHSSRFFFDKDKGAFRAGHVETARWDADSIGFRSFASGYNTKASGYYSTALGNYTTASKDDATAFGVNTTASGYYSTAMGISTLASGQSSTAMGQETKANGFLSTAMGALTTASGDYTTAMGLATLASGDYSTAMGQGTTASGDYSIALGQSTTASGDYSATMGRNTTAPSGYETTIGRYNTSYTPTNTTGWNATDRLFTIANGTSNANRSDALVVLKNGNIGIGISDPSVKLDLETTDELITTRVYNDNGNGVARSYVAANSGGHINLIANASGSDVYGIPSNYPGIATQYQDMVFATGTGGNNSTEKMRLTTSGRLGISTTDPDFALQVGDMGDGTSARANAWTMFSDRRWKKDLEVIPDALEKLSMVNGYYYNWKEGADTTRQVGVIAQEIEQILPQCVSTDAKGYKSVDYGKLTAWLIQVNKEQQQQIDGLVTENRQLKTQSDRIDRLESMLLDLQTATSTADLSTSRQH